MKCAHEKTGYTVRARGGVLFRWCAECGAAGVLVPCPGRRPIVIGWVRPGRGDGEERLEVYLAEARKLAAALAAGAARVDSPTRPIVPAERPIRGEAEMPDRAIGMIAAYDAPPGDPPPERLRRERKRIR